MLIVGGTGEMGQWFSTFFKERGFDVSIWGKSGRTEVSERLGVRFAHDLHAEVSRSDIVIISVPIDITEQVIAEVAPLMKTGSLLMDLTSLKTGPTRAMQKYAPSDVEILGTHPMFGPTIQNLHGQRFILTPINDRCQKWFPVIGKVLEENGAHIVIVGPEEHDRFVSVVQGLTHFAYITIGTTLNRLDFNVKESRRFMSPVYDIMLDFVGRILGQNPYLYAMIQMDNPEVIKVHEAFLQECHSTSEIVRKHDIEGFVTKMKEAAIHFGDTSPALRRSDKLINFKISEYELLLASVGEECGLLHVYTGKIHVGKVWKVTPTEVLLAEGTKTVSLKVENIQLLSSQELKEWKMKKLIQHKRDISVIVPENADPAIILDVLSCISNIAGSEIIDTYLLERKKSVTYRISILADKDPDNVQADVERILCGIGCRLRL
jgi:prephenate dehydrogenase